MPKITVTADQRDILRHSLGADHPRNPGFRNHFATSPDCDSWEVVQRLVKKGLMRQGATIPGGLIYFHVTDAGKQVVDGTAVKTSAKPKRERPKP